MSELPQGQVRIEYIGDGWFQMQIGRARGTKRFNLHLNEAAQLCDQIQPWLPHSSMTRPTEGHSYLTSPVSLGGRHATSRPASGVT